MRHFGTSLGRPAGISGALHITNSSARTARAIRTAATSIPALRGLRPRRPRHDINPRNKKRGRKTRPDFSFPHGVAKLSWDGWRGPGFEVTPPAAPHTPPGWRGLPRVIWPTPRFSGRYAGFWGGGQFGWCGWFSALLCCCVVALHIEDPWFSFRDAAFRFILRSFGIFPVEG